MATYQVEVWRDGGPGTGTLVMRSFTDEGLFVDFTRDSPAAGSHTYNVYIGMKTPSSVGFVGFTRLALMMAHR